ncbi:MAG: hypothetical protein Q9163_005756 [Psora crenata]
MALRALSPAASENEVDIAGALFQNESDASSEYGADSQHPDRKARMADGMPALEDDDSDDAAFIADSLAAANRKASNLKGRSVKKGGGFQAMGLNANLLKAITRKGFSVPTPIQRKTIPMVLDGQDVVGMARTGSGKTAAFVVPMIEKLKSHSAKVGARALIMSPSRELALQTLKVVKELGRGTDLTCVLLVGGDSLEEQFGLMSSNPDIVIATPGRFLHLKVEMGLDLSLIRYVVFDEADRLFEMGFAAQLTEILHALPQSRQTLLFSATLPKSLVEFARAGLQEPTLVRLDAESKISPDLQNAFFILKSAEKEGALLHILSDIIRVPLGQTEAALRAKADGDKTSKKRKHGDTDSVKPNESPTEHSTIVFAATKHHVDYLATLLRQFGYAVSHAYGSLDQTARKMHVQDFRTGMTNILVVTDVAARGIDIPILANVINYDFPPQGKLFVHRVGRTARAGQRGWSYSLVRASDAPYLLDLQLFLGKKLVLGRDRGTQPSYANDIVVGNFVRDQLERHCEWVGKLLDADADLQALRSVAAKGEKLYLRTRNSASVESARRAKELSETKSWTEPHPLFNESINNADMQRVEMMARVSGFRPQETVFEIGKKGTGGEAAEIMKKRRTTLDAQRRRNETMARSLQGQASDTHTNDHTESSPSTLEGSPAKPGLDVNMDSASEADVEITFATPSSKQKHDSHPDRNFKSSEYFMSYTPTSTNPAEERAYGVHSGSNTNSNFVTAARSATMNLSTDDGGTGSGVGQPSRMRWDKRSKKYVSRANDEDGSKGVRYIRGESGQKIAASFRSGRFEAWKKNNRISKLPRVGESEAANGNGVALGGSHVRGGKRRFKHKSAQAPKEPDKYRDDFHKKRKLVEKAKDERRGRFRDGPAARPGKGKAELKGLEAVGKERIAKEKRREKTGKGVKKGKGRKA